MKKKFIGMVAVLTFVITCALFIPKTLGKTECVSVGTGLDLTTTNCYLVDYASGSVMYAKGEDERKPIASMVKIMTCLMTFEAIDRGEIKLSDKVVISKDAANQTGSEMFLDANEQYSVNDLIKGMIVVSANDASVAIAETLAGSENMFTGKMNERAMEMGLSNTVFANATGFPTVEAQYSSAKDVSILTRKLLTHKEYYKFSKIWLEDYTHPSGRVTQFANTNKLIRHYKGCDSGKTGFTDSAKFCLSASAERDGMRVIGTILGANSSKERFGDMSKMFNYAFGNFKSRVYINKGDATENTKVAKGKVDFIKPILSENLALLVSKNAKDGEVRFEYNNLVAPIMASDKVGSAVLYVDNVEVSRVDLIAGEDVPVATFWDYVKKITQKM